MTDGRPSLSPLEHEVMSLVWKHGEATAASLVVQLKRPLTNASVRTLLRRLETKGYVRHEVRGRTFVYVPKIGETQAAARAVRRLVQRFFKGSAGRLMSGLVDEGLVTPEEVRALSRRLRRMSRQEGK